MGRPRFGVNWWNWGGKTSKKGTLRVKGEQWRETINQNILDDI